MALTPLQNQILAAVDAAAEEITGISRQMHAHPELSEQEHASSALLADALAGHGFRVERNFAGMETAFCARKGDGSRPVVAFLAEYDALPGVGHACGHNIIAGSALSAGIGLGSVIDHLPGEVWVIGTPAEETVGGKVTMVEEGAFKDVDAALMVHPHPGNYTTVRGLALSAWQVSFYGKAAHAAAAPWEGVNALDALVLTYTSLSALRQQLRPEARLHGIISKGGDAPNIIPEHTVGRFYLRAPSRAYVDIMLEKFCQCAEAAALATGCKVELERFENDFDDMLNNLTLAERMRDYMQNALGAGPFGDAPEHFGSIDMGNVSHVVPAIHVLVDITHEQPLSLHSHEFAALAAAPYAEAAMLRSGKGLALTGHDVLANPEFLAQAQAEFLHSQGQAEAGASQASTADETESRSE